MYRKNHQAIPVLYFSLKSEKEARFLFQSLILGSVHIDTSGCCDLHVIQISILEVTCKLGGIILSNNSIYVNIVDPSFLRHAPSISQTYDEYDLESRARIPRYADLFGAFHPNHHQLPGKKMPRICFGTLVFPMGETNGFVVCKTTDPWIHGTNRSPFCREKDQRMYQVYLE